MGLLMHRCPPASIQIDAFVIWEEMLDRIARAQEEGLSQAEFDALLVEETDFSPEARNIIWELSQALWQDSRWGVMEKRK